jgi:DNA-binding Lrp family transcriptional regulator
MPDSSTLAVMKADLEPASKRILYAMLASPKTPSEVSRIYGIPVAVVWQKVRRLEELGLLREVLAFVDSAGLLRRYFEGVLPIDEAEDERIVETRV